MKAGKGNWLLALSKALQGRAPRISFLCAFVSRSSRSSLAFMGRTAVSTKTDRTSEDLKDSEKQNMPPAPRILPSTFCAFGLSMAEEQDLPNSRIHGADLDRWCSFFHSPGLVPIKSHMKSCCTALYICIFVYLHNVQLHDRCNHPNYCTNCLFQACSCGSLAVGRALLTDLSITVPSLPCLSIAKTGK